MDYLEDIGGTSLLKLKKRTGMIFRKNPLVFILFLSTFLWTGCHRSKNTVPDTMLSGKAEIAADEALMPLMNAELDVFQSIYKYSSVECKFLSEYEAMNLLLQEKIRLAIVGRPLNQKEIDYFKSRDIVPESIPLAYDAIALIVPTENKILTLTTEQIRLILSGAISDWNQLENSGKSGDIQLIFDAKSSGVIRFLDEKLKLNNKISGNVKFAGNSKNLMDLVSESPNGIGFVGYNWLSENESLKVQETLKRIHLLAISSSPNDGGEKSFMPSVGNIYNDTYPLTRKVYALYTDPSASLARGFLAHLTSERGQKIIYRCGLKPESDFQRLIKIKSGF